MILGSLVPRAGLQHLTVQVVGTIPDLQLGHLKSLLGFDTRLSGSLPQNIGAWSSLENLMLGDSLLSGSLPLSFRNLQALGVLDLSHRNLDDGMFDGDLSNLYIGQAMSHLHLKYNKFSGMHQLHSGALRVHCQVHYQMVCLLTAPSYFRFYLIQIQ